MKKVLLAFDGAQFSEGAFEFARQLNELHSILLTGVFIPQLSYANLWSYADGMAGAAFAPMLEQEDTEQLENNIERFKTLCTQQNIAYSVHKDYYDFALPELKRETRFADLLIIGSETFYETIVGAHTNDYLKDALHDSECPVIVVPEKYKFPKLNIIAYDGSASSVYALKQFAYLFPELRAQETVVVYSSNEEGIDIPQEQQLQELAAQHFLDLSFRKLEVSSKGFNNWMDGNRGAILVCGAYSRSLISQMFHKSFSQSVIESHKLPVFIAHK